MAQLSPALVFSLLALGRVWESKSSSLHARHQSLLSTLVGLVQTLLSQTPKQQGLHVRVPKG